MSSKSDEGAQNADLGLIIFLAILLHKAPAALGFGSFLRHERIPDKLLIKHLVVNTSKFIYIIVFHCSSPNRNSWRLLWPTVLGKWSRLVSVDVLGRYLASDLSRLLLVCSNDPHFA